jgi:ethanolamine ammonia-lyase large subunit
MAKTYQTILQQSVYRFNSLRTLLGKASPIRSGDQLAEVASLSLEEQVAAQIALAEVPLKDFLSEAVIPYEDDEVTRLIIDSHEPKALYWRRAVRPGASENWCPMT